VDGFREANSLKDFAMEILNGRPLSEVAREANLSRQALHKQFRTYLEKIKPADYERLRDGGSHPPIHKLRLLKHLFLEE